MVVYYVIFGRVLNKTIRGLSTKLGFSSARSSLLASPSSKLIACYLTDIQSLPLTYFGKTPYQARHNRPRVINQRLTELRACHAVRHKRPSHTYQVLDHTLTSTINHHIPLIHLQPDEITVKTRTRGASKPYPQGSVPKFYTNFKEKTRYNLREHLYAEIIPRPSYRYIGAPRIINGRPVDERCFSLAQSSSPGRAFQWSIDDQAWAVSNGFFLHRSGYANRVNIIWIDRFNHDTQDGRASIEELQRREFLEQSKPRYERLYGRAMRFIKQQDQFGYSGAWDKRVQFYSNQLIWYRAYRVEHKNNYHLSAHGRAEKAKAIARKQRSIEARKHGYARYVADKFILD